MLKVLLAIFKLLAPVGIQNDPEKQHAWRWAVFTVLMVVIVVISSSLLLVTGEFPGIDSGYVSRVDVKAMSADVASRAKTSDLNATQSVVGQITARIDFITKSSMEESIRSKLTTACVTKDLAFKSELEQEVAQLEDQYYALTKEGYRQPECSEL
jgi:hypothetical protein